MRLRTPFAVLAPLALAASLSAQTPIPYPSGCPIPYTFVNETTSLIEVAPCFPAITSLIGSPIVQPPCPQILLLLGPGETYTIYWDQTDETGSQLPPDIYFIDGVPYSIGTASAAVEPLGPPRVGFQRSFHLCSLNGANLPYVLLASGSSTSGFVLCAGLTFPLDFDAILAAQVTGSPVFASFLGFLDGDGRSTAPTLVLPSLPTLAGLDVHLAFTTFDPFGPCGFGDTSPARVVTIQP